MRKQPLNRYYNVQKWVPNAGGGSGNDWLRVKNTLGIQIVGIHITDLSRERFVIWITPIWITFG